MTTRRTVLIILGALLLFGVINFVVGSIRTRNELAKIASAAPARQEEGVRNLMRRNALFDALQGGAPMRTRLNAIAALERIAARGNQKEAFNQLLQMLKDPDTESAEAKTHPVRDAARDAVARVGTLYTERLLDAAKDADAAIRDQSREAIKKIGAPLKEAMAARLGDAALRAPLGEILAGIGPETVPLVTPYLQAAKLPPADKPDDLAKAKVELIEILGKYKVPTPPPPARPTKPGETTAAAGPTAEEIARGRALVSDAAAAIIPFKEDANPNVRRTVITSLSNIALPVAAPTLIAALNDQTTDSDARAAAAGALGAIATPAANAAMVRALSDYDLRVATAAAAGLRRAGDRAAASIAQALAHPDPAVRARAADAAGGMTTPALAARALSDPDAGVRAAAAGALGDIAIKSAASSSVITPLLSALDDPDGTVAETAALALGRVGQPAVAPLVARLQAGDTVAYRAAQALERIGRDAVDPLLTVARSGRDGARWAAITLGQIGDTRAAPVLETLSQSTDPDTAYAASAALTKVRQG